jgi:NTP pyrophosphatase (non-canonical NTP hydrolase)
MELNDAQNKVKELLGEIEHPKLGTFIALTEEIGEVANEIMKLEIYEENKDTTKLKQEIADVLFMLIELANVYDINLQEEFDKKYEDLKPRAEKWKIKLKDIMSEKRKKHN